MISYAHSAIFVHIPKTGGQSVANVFLAVHGLTWDKREALLMAHNPDPARGPKRLAHLKASEYVACGHVGQQTFDCYFKFSFVRNPWDRAVSYFHYAPFGEKAGIPFGKFIEDLGARRAAGDLRFEQQVRFVCDREGRCLVDFIGRFENLQEDFAKICDRLKLGAQSLSHTNAAPARKPYREYYDAKTRELVAALFREDIERFGYTFI
jgi:hypothetical protein